LTPTLQLEEVKIIELHDAPKLLVQWTPRWEDFVSSIGPAFSRSGPRLAGEAQYGVFPYRGLLASVLLEAFFVFVIAILPREIQQLRPYAPPRLKPYEVIYYSGDELPQVEDLGGSESGAKGRAGGHEARHRTQTIHVARGRSLAGKIVDAPNLKIPASSESVANLLAFKTAPVRAIPGVPALDGLHSSLTAPNLPAKVIAPAPEVARNQTRRGLTLGAVVPPAPTVASANTRSAPALAAEVVAPAPTVRSEHMLYMPALDPSIIGPAPKVSRDRQRGAPSLNANVIAPAPESVTNDRERSAPSLRASVVPPAPSGMGREVAASRIRMNDPAVVPPPVSAPERATTRPAKLTLPAPSVIAPPPSADSTRDLRRLESGGVGATAPNVVPPPPASAGNTSLFSSIIGKIFGTQDVVPPPPAVSSASGSSRVPTGTLAANVIPPPPSAASPEPWRHAALGTNVIPPPPAVNASAGATAAGGRGTSLAASVVPPPPSVSGVDPNRQEKNNQWNRTQLASNVVPPPPTVESSPGLSGSGRKGFGLGSDLGTAAAPPKAASTADAAGALISPEPGSKVGLPGTSRVGSLAMSPAGIERPGMGGLGGGEGIGHGENPGSGLTGAREGAGKSRSGQGSDASAREGISPTPGPGGAGSTPTGAPAVPGVDVRGGNTVITLPSFESDGSGDPSVPGRSSVKKAEGPAITIVATSRSGGAFDFYGKLPGDNYTVYVDTAIGTVVMQFAEVDPGAHSQSAPLTGPQGLRTDLPANLPHVRVVVKCRLDANGNLGNFQVLEPGPAAMMEKIMAKLPGWKFRPAMRGAQPVAVNAILGFNIDTNDRY
jgi:hypothetical protein